MTPERLSDSAIVNGLKSSTDEPILEVVDLTTYFFLRNRIVKAVDGLDLRVARGQMVALVGESGSGKTATALSLMSLVPEPGRIVKGQVKLLGVDLLTSGRRRLDRIRGSGVTMVFQNPRAALDPSFKIGGELLETLRVQRGMNNRQAVDEAKRLLEMVHVRDPKRILDSYPHELSSGTCQRVMLAIALACRPKLLIADEPTTLLDALVQAEILSLIDELRKVFGMSVLLITHDLGIVAPMADSVTVMYAGKAVEVGSATQVLGNPQHPYTIGLLNSIPQIGRRLGRLVQIEGQPPDLSRLPSGCTFAPRCREAVPFCSEVAPHLKSVDKDRTVRCHMRGEVPAQITLQGAMRHG